MPPQADAMDGTIRLENHVAIPVALFLDMMHVYVNHQEGRLVAPPSDSPSGALEVLGGQTESLPSQDDRGDLGGQLDENGPVTYARDVIGVPQGYEPGKVAQARIDEFIGPTTKADKND